MPHKQILHPRCNIGTNAHLIFTKSPISKFQECLGKVLLPIDFLPFHPIVILVWNELFCWFHTIWFWNGNTSLLSCHDFILLHPSPIIWLLRSFHLDYAFFFQTNDLLPHIHVVLCWYIGRTTCYKALTLVNFRMNSLLWFPSNRSCLLLWPTRNRLSLVANSWCRMTLTLYYHSSNLFQMSHLMGSIYIGCIETRVEAFSSDLPDAEHIATSCMLYYVLCVWYFNRNTNYQQYFWRFTRSSLTNELQIYLTFDRCSIFDLWEMIGSP